MAHRLDWGDVILFVKNKIIQDKAERLLKFQAGVKSAAKNFNTHGDYIKAHRSWLTEHINNNINLGIYFCSELINMPKQEDTKLIDILSKI